MVARAHGRTMSALHSEGGPMAIDSALTPSGVQADLPELAYCDLDDPQEVHRHLRATRERAPIAFGPRGPEVLTYDLAQTVLRDPRFCVPKGLGLQAQGITSGPLWDRTVRGILSLDGDEHHRLRRLVAKAFTPRAADQLRATMRETINTLLDPLTVVRQCDVVADIAREYPIAIICALLGAPDADWQQFSAWTDDIFKIFGLNLAHDTPAILRASDELDAYIDQMVDTRRTSPTDDLISKLIRAEDNGERLSRDELNMLVSAILTAGTDTTRNQLAAAIQTFCDHPQQWALLAEQPDLAPHAVDEVLRHSPIVFATMRAATQDVQLDGITIPEGTLISVNTAAANRDPAIYNHPDHFDITRHAPAPMLTFGGGIHYCLGAHLAKAELAEALTTMAHRMPHIRRNGPAPWKPPIGISGPTTLHINYDTRR